jgi:hypothetical protein
VVRTTVSVKVQTVWPIEELDTRSMNGECIFLTQDLRRRDPHDISVYVDNLQIVHSAELDAKCRGPKGCAYNKFMDQLAADWDVTDEGPMEDLLGIEVDYNDNGSITILTTHGGEVRK